MKVSELTGAQLDYWTARAQRIPAEQLSIRRIQRSSECHCVREWVRNDPIIGRDMMVLSPSSNWAQGGPLVEKHALDLIRGFNDQYFVTSLRHKVEDAQHGDTPLIAICRAVVRAAFGDEVAEVPVSG